MQPCGLLCADCSRRAMRGGVAGEVPRTEMYAVKKVLGLSETQEPEERKGIVEYYKGWIIEITPSKFSQQWISCAKKEGDDGTRKFEQVNLYNYKTKHKLLFDTKTKIDAVINKTSTPPPTSPPQANPPPSARAKTQPPAQANPPPSARAKPQPPAQAKEAQVELSKRTDPSQVAKKFSRRTDKKEIKHEFSQRKGPPPPVSSTVGPPSVSGNNGPPPVS